MNLQTVEFLRSHSLDDLFARYAITTKRHGQHPNLVFLKYDQIESPMHEAIVQECRGLILDEADDWRVVSFPFRKFFNYGESNAAPIDWGSARVYEKLDGSLMALYWYAGAWQVASNGTPDAGGPVQGSTGTFAELFWKTWNASGYRLPAPPNHHDDEHYSFIFELMTPFNRVIVRHERPRLVCIGVRELEEFNEFAPDGVDAERLRWEIVRSFPLDSFDACVAAAGQLDPIASEGFVVCDGNFNRVKIKSPKYVALAHLKESVTPRRLLDIIRANESEEFLTYFPEWRGDFDAMRARYAAACDEIEADYARLRDIPDQKTFAIEAVKTRYSSPLFAIRKGKCSTVREWFASSSLQAVERAVGLDADERAGLLAGGMA